MILTLVVLVLQAAAVAVVVTQGSLFDRLREIGPKLWRDLLECPLCFGTWAGMLGAAPVVLRWHPLSVLDFADAAWFVLSTGGLSGCVAWLFSAVIERLEGVE